MKKRNREAFDTNRTVKQRTTNRGLWCPKCDGIIVHKGQRCPDCGYRNNKKKHKPRR